MEKLTLKGIIGRIKGEKLEDRVNGMPPPINLADRRRTLNSRQTLERITSDPTASNAVADAIDSAVTNSDMLWQLALDEFGMPHEDIERVRELKRELMEMNVSINVVEDSTTPRSIS